MNRVLALVLAAVLVLPSSVREAYAEPAPAASREPSEEQALLARALDAIESLRLDEAEVLLDQLGAQGVRSPAVLFARAKLAFFAGRYAEAVKLADEASAMPFTTPRRSTEDLRVFMDASLRVTRDYERKASPDGRYVVLYPPGKDAVVAELALDVLAAADGALSEAFGVQIPGPLRLEIYPSAETLAEVSPLTVEQIHTTGTVALSKWNRLMITSPRALVRGYPWADTITHELVHLVLSVLSAERAPVWLQEGTAKLLERSWRGGGLALDAGSRALLQDAKREGTLLTFEQMHPSIAMLPSEEQAILAFAEVATFMEAYVKQHGREKLRAALDLVAAGQDARNALAKAAGTTFASLEQAWKASVPSGKAPAARMLKSRFRTGDGPDDESADVEETTARKHMRVGDLLWDRGHPAAAAKEYEKAHKADTLDPIVAARWGRAALAAGNPSGAVQALARQQALYPNHASTHAVLGAAYLQLDQRSQAVAALREALWLNPFDPAPSCNLAKASDDPREKQRASEACALLK